MSASPGQPLITFALISYGDEKFIREAVEGAFAQTYQPLEIILSNDCSLDATFEIMKTAAARYKGPHKLVVNRNEKNLGTGGHVNRIMEMAQGEIIVIAAGDDISLKERTQKMYEIFENGRGRIKSVFSNALVIDEAGNGKQRQYLEPLPDQEFVLDNIVRNRDFGIVAGSSHAWTRDLFDTFGPLMTPLSVEDSPIAFRAALLGQIAFTDEVLIKHRRHDNNTWHYTSCDPIKSFRYQTFERDAVLRNWLRDIQALERLMPGRKKELEAYGKILRGRITETQEDIRLFRSSWIRRGTFILKKMLHGMPLRMVGKKIGVFLVPSVYRQYFGIKYHQMPGKRARVRAG